MNRSEYEANNWLAKQLPKSFETSMRIMYHAQGYNPYNSWDTIKELI